MSAFEEYVDMYGLHFNKKLYEYAVSMMRDRNNNKVPLIDKEKVTEFLKNHGITLKNDKGHDAAYVYMMARSDYFGSAITDDNHLAMFVRDFLDDIDGSKTKAFDHFVVDCRSKEEPIYWDEML